jgi:hypothetical protein
MATLTLTLDPEIIEAAKLEAERRHVTLDQYFAGFVTTAPKRMTDEEKEEFIQLMRQRPLGSIDRPLTREEIYAERTWPRS